MKRIGMRRQALLAATAACVTLGALAGPAAAISLDSTTDTSVTIDGDSHWFNETTPLTSGGYQYLVYWDAESPGLKDPAPLKVTRRRLSDNNLQSTSFAGRWEMTDPDDQHNQVKSGLSTIDGRIHIAWSTHNDELHYVYSSAGCLSQATFSNCTWTHTNTQADRTHESDYVTYPIFFSDHDGNLFMTWRWGVSEDGDQYLNKYNNNGTWTAVGEIMKGSGGGAYDPDGAGPIPSSSNRNAYIWGFQFDRTGRLHAMWNWRDQGGSWGQHCACYAYSDDDGVTWKNSAGTTVATAGSDPLKVTDSGLEVVSLPYGTHFSGYDMALDSHNQPHAVLPVSDRVTDSVRDANLRQRHIWRTTSGTWYTTWIDSAGGNSQTYSIGNLMFDRADTAYYVYNRNNLGWGPWNVSVWSQEELRQDFVTWQGGDHLNIQQMSGTTAIVNNDHVNTSISTSGTNQIRIRMRNNTEGDDFFVSWTTDQVPGWSLARSQTFTNAITANDGFTDRDWKTYTFTITDSDWRGTLRDLEIDPILGTTAEAGDEIDIDYIRLTNSGGAIAKQWEFNEGAEIVVAEASATDNWLSWSIGAPLPGVSGVWGDSVFAIDDMRYAAGTDDGKVMSFIANVQGGPQTEQLTVRDFDILGDTTIKFWNFDADTQGWTVGGDVSGFGWESDGGANSIAGTITGADSRLYSPNELWTRIDCDVIHVRLKNTSAATTGRVYFITERDPTFDLTKSKSFSITPNSGYTEYTIDMSAVPGWDDGEILQRLRIDPSEDAGVRSGSFKIHRVYIAPS